MKKWALVILPLLIIITFIGLYLFRGHKRVMEPGLIEFFGGLDLGMTRRQMNKIEPELSSYGSDLWSYYARSKNNPILNLDITFYDEYIIGTLLGTASIDHIRASFHEDYIDAGGETSFEYWTDYFQNSFGKKPLHYFYYNKLGDSRVDINLWHFDNYNFQIREFVHRSVSDADFSIYFDDDYIPNLTTIDELYFIGQKGDTLNMAKYKPRVTE